MPQFNVSRKIVANVQLWVSLFLVLLATVFSLTPIITLTTFENAGAINDMMDEVLPSDMDGFEIPEEIGVTAPKLIGSVSTIVKIVSVSIDASKDDLTAAEQEELTKKMEELEAYLQTDKGKEDIVTALSIAASFTNAFKSGNAEENDNFLSMVLNVLISVIAEFAVIIMSLILPIMLIFYSLSALIKSLKNIKTPEVAAAAVGNKLSNVISFPLILMLFQCVVPGMKPGSGVMAVCYIAVASTVLNFVISRLREYPVKQFKYLNILQGTALVGVIGFLVFFFNIIKTGIFKAFTGGKFALYMAEAIAAKALEEHSGQVSDKVINNAYVIDGLLMVVYLVLMLSCVAYLNKVTRRLSCAVKKERPRGLIGLFFRDKASDSNIVTAVATLFIYIIPTYIMGVKHYFDDIYSTATEGDASFIILSEDGEKALSIALVGIIFMIVAEVSMIALRKVFCKDLDAREAEELMMGLAKTSAEQLADAEKNVADLKAEVAAETVPEEAVTTEEEAPAEDKAEAEV